MGRIIGWYLSCAIIVVCALGAGVWAAPAARALYDRAFPEPDFVTGDFRALYGEAGNTVVLFSTSTCPYCRQTREWLARQHVDYRDYLVDQSDDAKQRFEHLDGGPVPLLFIGDRRITGFREGVLDESLALARGSPADTPTANASPDVH
jgi:glutaredoxin